MSKCSESLCMKPAKRKNLCESHYYKLWRKQEKELDETFDVNDFWLFVKKELKID